MLDADNGDGFSPPMELEIRVIWRRRVAKAPRQAPFARLVTAARTSGRCRLERPPPIHEGGELGTAERPLRGHDDSALRADVRVEREVTVGLGGDPKRLSTIELPSLRGVNQVLHSASGIDVAQADEPRALRPNVEGDVVA